MIDPNHKNVNSNDDQQCKKCTYTHKCRLDSRHIFQLDGNITNVSDASDNSSNDESFTSEDESTFDTDDEVDNEPIPANLSPVLGQNVQDNQPLRFDVNLNKDAQASFLPLCLMMNARSIYNKPNNLNEMLSRIGPSVTLISETWEREKNRLDNVLNSRRFKHISCYRKNKSPGGGCAIIYNESQFSVINPEI